MSGLVNPETLKHDGGAPSMTGKTDTAVPLRMNRDVFIACAVTGSGGTQDRSPHVLRSPKQIADSAIDAAKAGAAIIHCYVRDPETRAPSRRLYLYPEVTDRNRSSNVDAVLNLTADMRGDIVFGPTEASLPVHEATSVVIGPPERTSHISACLPELCALYCGVKHFANADYVMTNSADMTWAIGLKPEIEAFNAGHLRFAKEQMKESVLDGPLVQLCIGVAWGAPNDINTLMTMVNSAPSDWTWAAFNLGRNQMPYTAKAAPTGWRKRARESRRQFVSRKGFTGHERAVGRAPHGRDFRDWGHVIGLDAERENLGQKNRAAVDLRGVA